MKKREKFMLFGVIMVFMNMMLVLPNMIRSDLLIHKILFFIILTCFIVGLIVFIIHMIKIRKDN